MDCNIVLMKRFILLMTLFISCLPKWYEDESFLAGTYNIGAIEYTISDCSSEYFYKYDDLVDTRVRYIFIYTKIYFLKK